MDSNAHATHRILVVDDEALFLMALVESLQEAYPNAQIDAVTNGQLALKAIETIVPDLLITDLSMPVMDGFWLLASLSDRNYRIPTIVITAHGSSDTRRFVQSHGVMTMLDKPLDFETLRHHLDSSMAKRADASAIVHVTLPGFLQLLESERQTCTVFVVGPGARGHFIVVFGQLVAARVNQLEGLDACYEMMRWHGPPFSLGPVPPALDTKVLKPLISMSKLILDSARRADEAGRDSPTGPAAASVEFDYFELADDSAPAMPARQLPRQPPPVPRPVGRTIPPLPQPASRPGKAATPAPPMPAPVLPKREASAPQDEPGRARAAATTTPFQPGSAVGDPKPTVPAPSGPTPAQPSPGGPIHKEPSVANIEKTLKTAMDINGCVGVALADWQSGMTLGTAGTGLNMEVAAAGNTDVVRAKMAVMSELGIPGGIEDILITLTSQYHIIMPTGTTLFFYAALDRKTGNLGLARHQLRALVNELKVS
jgi:CheY-like chemotaxis protein/predicted regulator of Ras-like GTPase activity (Roadblock/LC7/MglB family)